MKQLGAILGVLIAEIMVILLSVEVIKIFLLWTGSLTSTVKIFVALLFWSIYLFLMFLSLKYSWRWMRRSQKK